MTMAATIGTHLAPPGTRGFDCDSPVTKSDAEAFMRAGYRFAVRYVPRVMPKRRDLTAAEVLTIVSAGLGIMAVQHVELPGWRPNAVKGAQYGARAAAHCRSCGLIAKTMCWLDLEEVAADVPHSAIIGYCNSWYDAVATGGFTPGIYVGYGARLSADELYYKLKFRRYWSAYNLNRDQFPAVRGVQMRQGDAKPPHGVPFDIDENIAMADRKGDVPLVMAPADWLEDRP